MGSATASSRSLRTDATRRALREFAKGLEAKIQRLVEANVIGIVISNLDGVVSITGRHGQGLREEFSGETRGEGSDARGHYRAEARRHRSVGRTAWPARKAPVPLFSSKNQAPCVRARPTRGSAADRGSALPSKGVWRPLARGVCRLCYLGVPSKMRRFYDGYGTVLCNAYSQLFPMAGRGPAFCCCALARRFPSFISVSQARLYRSSQRLADSFCCLACGRLLRGSRWPSMSCGSRSHPPLSNRPIDGFTSCWRSWPRR